MKQKYLIRGIGIGMLLMTAVFYLLRGFNKEPLSKEEIIRRAKSYGMMTLEEVNEKKLEFLKNDLAEEEDEKDNKILTEKEEGEPFPSEDGKEDKASGEEKNENTSPEEGEGSNSESGNQEREGAKTGGNETGTPEKTETGANTEGETEPMEAELTEEEGEDPSEGEEETEDPEPESTSTGKVYTYSVIAGTSAVRVCNDLHALGLIDDAKKFNKYLADHDFARKIRVGTFTFHENESYYSIASKLISKELHP